MKKLINFKDHMKNENYLKVDYDDLVKNYNNQLVTKLRDFGDNLLDLWVPDDDILQSLLGLLFSLTQNNCKKASLTINRHTFQNYYVQFKNIFQKFSEFSIYETKQKYEIKILITDIKKLNEINNTFFNNKRSKVIKNIKSYKNLNNNKKLLLDHIYSFPSKVLKDKNLFFIEKAQMKYYLQDDDYFHAHIKNINLFVKIRENSVISVKFNCNISRLKVLINFSKAILNTPIIEAYEHGVMKLESSFRKKNIKKKIKGVITPFIIKSIFPDIQSLMYNIYSQYLTKNRLDDRKNLYDSNLSDSWKKLSKELKENLINKTISNYCKDSEIQFKFLEIEDDVKILIDINETKDTGTKKYTFLLGLEKEIRKKLDRRLEVFYKDEPDSNKLRQKNL